MSSQDERRTATVTEIAAPTTDVRVVRMRPKEPLRFQAGQYVRLWFDGLPARDYSLGNRPGEAALEFHIRITAESAVGCYVAEGLRVGEAVGVDGPYGDAFLRREHRGPLLAVAGGTGVVPIQSIVTTALESGMQQQIHLYWGAYSAADLYAKSRFRDLAARHRNLHVECSVAVPDSEHRKGYVSEVVAADFSSVTGFKAYVAGPPAMVSATQDVLLARGLKAGDLHADPFVPGDHHSRTVSP